MDRERIAKDLHSMCMAGAYLRGEKFKSFSRLPKEWKNVYLGWADITIRHFAELGYTHQPLLNKFRQAIKDARAGNPLDLTESEFELFSAIEVLGVEQAKSFEPPADKVEAVAEKLKAVWLAGHCIREFKPDEVPIESLRDIAREILIATNFEPVELEALGDEELRMADSNLGDDFYDADDNEAWLIDRRNISQTTIRSNQEKFGPLYRVKDSSGGKNSRKV